jgi:hypothetical protein
LRNFLWRPPLNHVVGLLDYGPLRARDLANEQVADRIEIGDIAPGSEDQRRDADLTQPAD